MTKLTTVSAASLPKETPTQTLQSLFDPKKIFDKVKELFSRCISSQKTPPKAQATQYPFAKVASHFEKKFSERAKIDSNREGFDFSICLNGSARFSKDYLKGKKIVTRATSLISSYYLWKYTETLLQSDTLFEEERKPEVIKLSKLLEESYKWVVRLETFHFIDVEPPEEGIEYLKGALVEEWTDQLKALSPGQSLIVPYHFFLENNSGHLIAIRFVKQENDLVEILICNTGEGCQGHQRVSKKVYPLAFTSVPLKNVESWIHSLVSLSRKTSKDEVIGEFYKDLKERFKEFILAEDLFDIKNLKKEQSSGTCTVTSHMAAIKTELSRGTYKRYAMYLQALDRSIVRFRSTSIHSLPANIQEELKHRAEEVENLGLATMIKRIKSWREHREVDEEKWEQIWEFCEDQAKKLTPFLCKMPEA